MNPRLIAFSCQIAALTVVACGSDPHPSGSSSPGGDSGAEPDAAAPSDAAASSDATADAALPDTGPVVIAEGQQSPSGIAVDATGVFFANRDAGTIVRCPHRGCGATGPVVLASNQDAPISVAVNATHLYWVTGYHAGETGAPPARPVFRCLLPSCDAATIEPFDQGDYQPYDVHVTADTIYFAAWPSFGSCPTSGCSDGNVGFGGGPAVSIDVDEPDFYVALYGWSQVTKCPIPGCTGEMPSLLADVVPLAITVDDTSLYVVENDYLFTGSAGQPDATPNRILKCPPGGCTGAPEVLASGDISPYAVADYGNRLYYTNIEHGSVVSIPKHGVSTADGG